MKALIPLTAVVTLSTHSFLSAAIPSSVHILKRDDKGILPHEPSGEDPESGINIDSPLTSTDLLTYKASLSRREPLGVAQVFGDLLPRANPPAQSCAKCTHQFCTNPDKNYRDQSDCNCKPCKNTKNKPDPQTNDRCIPDCQGKQAATGPKDSSGDATCQDCPAGQKPDADHSDCEKSDCPDGQVNKKQPDGSTKCQSCPSGQKPNAAGDDCEKDNCSANQINKKQPDGSTKCEPCPTGQKPNLARDGCIKNDDDDDKCPPGQKPASAGTKRDAKCVNDKDQKNNKMKEELPREQAKFKKLMDDQEEKRKRTRIGKCLPDGALALTTDSFFMASGFFMPQFIEQLNIPDYWPSDIGDCPMDVPIEQDPDGYNKQWMDMARYQTYIEMTGACMANPYSCPTKRDENGTEVFDLEAMYPQPPRKVKREPVDHILIPYSTELDKRVVPLIADVVEIVLSFLGRATSALRALGGAALSRLGQVAEDGIKLATRTAKDFGQKAVRDEMEKGAKKIADQKYNKWWKDCLKGNKLPASATGH